MIENKNRSAEEAKSIEVAEDNREVDWKSKSFIASIFMGDLDMSMCAPFPEQDPEDRAAGDAIIAKVDAWAAENLDGDQIDEAREIPPRSSTGWPSWACSASRSPPSTAAWG